jgi:NAD(P)-dependent dehydrogenase (short-subunit alcohol dehydrogenase family)
MAELDGKVVLVTGAQQGIGRGMAIAFAAAGADIAINYLDNMAAAEEVAGEVQGHGRRARLIQGDVAKVNDCARMVETTVEAFGRLDVLINNAGVFPRVPFLSMRESDWDLVLDVNLKGTCFTSQAAAKAMIAGGQGGAIINLSSSSIRGAVRGVHYSASKGGVITLTRSMALELAPHRIRVNAIAPGTTDTAQPRYGHSEAELVEVAKSIPFGRLAQPEDIASVAVFLASAASGWITGQTLHVNGGLYLR